MHSAVTFVPSDKAFMRAWLNNPGAGVRAVRRSRAEEVLTWSLQNAALKQETATASLRF